MADTIYTHIVVGAGSAGCIVAARIAENENFDVVLIEAGPDYEKRGNTVSKTCDSRRVPMRGQSEIYDPTIDWNVEVEVSTTTSMHVPQAKLIGGGSGINGGTALRSTVKDSREWVALGNSAWDFDSVYNVYQSLEADDVRGTRGPHPLVRATDEETGRIQRAFMKACEGCGFERVPDLNETGAEGVGHSPVCREGSRRISAANTFIDPIRGFKNLTVLPETLVDRVEFSGTKATCVVLTSEKRISATREVVISAGAIFSPAILQRSGIGPPELLKELDIPLKAALPVGQNLSDHPCIPIMTKPREGAFDEDDYSLQCQTRWSSSHKPGAIDHQLVCFSYLFAQQPEGQIQQRSLSGNLVGHVAGVGCNLNKPTSLGTVTIVSKNVSAAPRVAPNYLTSPEDRMSARELVRKGYSVATSTALQPLIERPIGLDDSIVSSDARLDEYIQSHLTSTYHFCGSCRMASASKAGVVDQSGRVYGVQGLRVADASVIPTVPASNTMWTTMMFAERIGCSLRDGNDVGCERPSSKL